MSDRPENEGWIPSELSDDARPQRRRGRLPGAAEIPAPPAAPAPPSPEETADAFAANPTRVPAPPAEVAAELAALEARLTEAEEARAVEGEELLTRMTAIEVLIDHLNGRIVELAREAEEGPSGRDRAADDLDLRVGGLEHAVDAMGPMFSVPATIAALEQELIALGERLDARDVHEQLREELVSREIEARVSLAESKLGVRHGEDWEGMQDSVSAVERRSEGARNRIEERLAEQAGAATAALGDLEERLTTSLELLAGRLGASTGASGELAETMVARLETLEQDIVAIESRFGRMAGRLRAEDPLEAVSDAADEAEAVETVPPPASAPRPPDPSSRLRAPLPPPAQSPERTSGPINLNEATFEVLRSLGCSVTQTARILAARKVRGGFGSPEELSDVPGLPAAFRAELISRLTV